MRAPCDAARAADPGRRARGRTAQLNDARPPRATSVAGARHRDVLSPDSPSLRWDNDFINSKPE
ncbi:hypothetical protein C2U71_01715 [Burkholderia ubonensis]|nr:hypothetical protein EHZ18_01775 [Burkholderia vietnamiensis]TPQ48093.1 hypothetical protein C2U71_01715 [Burkholderia ubonensis]